MHTRTCMDLNAGVLRWSVPDSFEDPNLVRALYLALAPISLQHVNMK